MDLEIKNFESVLDLGICIDAEPGDDGLASEFLGF